MRSVRSTNQASGAFGLVGPGSVGAMCEECEEHQPSFRGFWASGVRVSRMCEDHQHTPVFAIPFFNTNWHLTCVGTLETNQPAFSRTIVANARSLAKSPTDSGQPSSSSTWRSWRVQQLQDMGECVASQLLALLNT